MAKFMIGRAAAFAASVGIALSGIALATPAAAQLSSCERRMYNRCTTNQYWYYAGYASPIDCIEDQTAQNCPPPEYSAHTVVLKPFTRA